MNDKVTAPGAGDPLDHDGDGKRGGAKPAATKVTYLTAKDSDEFGVAGRFFDLTSDEAKQGVADEVLVTPTAEQLAMRRL